MDEDKGNNLTSVSINDSNEVVASENNEDAEAGRPSNDGRNRNKPLDINVNDSKQPPRDSSLEGEESTQLSLGKETISDDALVPAGNIAAIDEDEGRQEDVEMGTAPPVDTRPIVHDSQMQPLDRLLAQAEEKEEDFQWLGSIDDEDALPLPAGFAAAMYEEDDLQENMAAASSNRIDDASGNNNQGQLEASTAVNVDEGHDAESNEIPSHLFQRESLGEAPMPPQFAEESAGDIQAAIRNKETAAVAGKRPSASSKDSRDSLSSENEDVENIRVVVPVPDHPPMPQSQLPDITPPQSQSVVSDPEQLHPSSLAPAEPSLSDATPVQFYEVSARLVVDRDTDLERNEDGDRHQQSPITRGTVYDATPVDLTLSWWQKHQRIILTSIGLAVLLMVGALVAIGVVVMRSPPPMDDEITSLDRMPPPESVVNATATSPPTPQVPRPSVPPSSSTPTQTPQTSVPTSPPTLPPPPPITGISNVTYLGKFLEIDCEHNCGPGVTMNRDTAVILPLLPKPSEGTPIDNLDSRWKKQIHVWKKNTTEPTNSTDGSVAIDFFEAAQRIDVDFQPGSTAIIGDTMVVGASWENVDTGAAYIYWRNSSSGLWSELQRILPEDINPGAKFGCDVDMIQGLMVIGALQDRTRLTGSVYIYRHEEKDATQQQGNSWAFEKKLAPPYDDKMQSFGTVVAIGGNNRIAVGDQAYGTNQTANIAGPKKKGAVWIYDYDQLSKEWTETNSGVMTNEDCDNHFGASIAFTDDLGLLVGCPGEDDKAGAIYYYEPSDTTRYALRQKVVVSSGGKQIGDPNQISVYGNVMLVGVAKRKVVYIFLRINNVWVETEKIVSPEGSSKFGNKLAMSGSHILVSSKYNAYFYELVEGPPTISCISATADRTLFKSLCELSESGCERYEPKMAIDGNVAVVSMNKGGLEIRYGDDGSYDKLYYVGADHAFGAVAVSGDDIVFGAPRTNEKNGSVTVYQFERTSGTWWGPSQLSPNVVRPQEKFGGAVDIDGDIIIAGQYDMMDKIGSGSAYIFRRTGSGSWPSWVEETKLLPDDKRLDGFGKSVSVIKDTVAIGDIYYKGSSGAVFVYEYEVTPQSWTQLKGTIINDDCDANFGDSLALTRNNGLLIGCPGEQNSTGAVYYYTQAIRGDQYILQQKIQLLDGELDDNFGGSDQLAVDGDIMIVGTKKENGAVHVFAKVNNTWIKVTTIESPPETVFFGQKVALSGMKVLVASIHNVYSYTLSNC